MACIFIILFLVSCISLPTSISQPPAPPPSGVCNGIVLSYVHSTGSAIPPFETSNPSRQPYRFESILTVLNAGFEELKSWRVFVGFSNQVVLVSASNAVLADGTSLPANVTDGMVLAGYPDTDLESAIETAGDWQQIQARIELVGTQFGIAPPMIPLPTKLSLHNDGFLCSPTSSPANETRVCCVEDLNTRSNVSVDEEFLPRQDGDLTIMYDVLSSEDTKYLAQVTLSNHNALRRLDNWQLSWDWMRDEFIDAMWGAYPLVVDANDCIFGRQGEFYKDLDFSTVLNCKRTPTIIDLPLDKENDTKVGMIPYCCRNGTILPPNMDPTKSVAAFQMQVYKMPPDLNRTQLVPPQNWKINGTLNPDYQCGPPVRVSPTLFPNPGGLSSKSTAVASWQVVCNITQVKPRTPKCCVSFSTFFNESVVPCSTCACGCNADQRLTCNATSPALLLPSEALLVPFDNRTNVANKHDPTKYKDFPNPLPCSDNCGVSINWHVLSDYKDGWTARMTLFNWGQADFPDWFAAVELDKSFPGFQTAYSFNGSVVPGSNNTIFFQGLPGLNYLIAEKDGAHPKKDPRVPGTQQTLISFTKKTTPEISVARGDVFPSKVYFNGEECSLPLMLPVSNGYRLGQHAVATTSSLLVLLMLMFLQL